MLFESTPKAPWVGGGLWVLLSQIHRMPRIYSNGFSEQFIEGTPAAQFAQQACRVPSCLTTLFGCSALGATYFAQVAPAAAENAGRSSSGLVPTPGQLRSAAPHQLHRRRCHLRRRHSPALMAAMEHVALGSDKCASTTRRSAPQTDLASRTSAHPTAHRQRLSSTPPTPGDDAVARHEMG